MIFILFGLLVYIMFILLLESYCTYTYLSSIFSSLTFMLLVEYYPGRNKLHLQMLPALFSSVVQS